MDYQNERCFICDDEVTPENARYVKIWRYRKTFCPECHTLSYYFLQHVSRLGQVLKSQGYFNGFTGGREAR